MTAGKQGIADKEMIAVAAKRNSSIDVFRMAAVALVIIQHYGLIYPRTSAAAMWLNLFSRGAVPFFFMVSGYFSWRDSGEKRTAYLKKQALTMAKILAVSSVIIIFFNHLFGYRIKFTLPRLRRLILFNEPSFLFDQAHMWYMLALIYVLLIAYALEKLKLNKAAYACAPLLLLAGVVLDVYLRFAGVRRACYTRNFLFDGLPFFCIGQFLRRYEGKIMPFFNKKRSVALLIISAAGLAVEAALSLQFNLASFDITFDRTMFLFLPLLGVGVFLTLLNFPNVGRGTFFAKYARDASLIVYIIHHIVEELIKIIAESVWGIKMYQHATARYFLILIFSSIIGFAYGAIAERLRSAKATP